MKEKKRMAWDGREVEATEHLFRAAGEFWNDYLVDDGSVLRLKIVMTEVNRLEGEYDDEIARRPASQCVPFVDELEDCRIGLVEPVDEGVGAPSIGTPPAAPRCRRIDHQLM